MPLPVLQATADSGQANGGQIQGAQNLPEILTADRVYKARMKDLAVDIEEMILAGNTVDDIVEKLGVPYDFVIEVGKWMQYIKTFRFAEEE